MWHQFNSVSVEKRPSYTGGQCRQDNGVVYRWTFIDGKVVGAVYVDGRPAGFCEC